MTSSQPAAITGQSLLDVGYSRALDLLHGNSTVAGILACTPGERAAGRHYTSIFGRDASICALGMAASGEPELIAAARAGLLTLAHHQAQNGRSPNTSIRSRRSRFLVFRLHRRHALVADRLHEVDRRTHGDLGLELTHGGGARLALACLPGASSGGACCNRTRRATGRTSCRAPASCFTRTRSGIR